jgi:superfamily II DNA or RNA helicase
MEKKSIELRNQKYISDVIVQILKIKYRSRPAPSNPSSLTSQYVAEKDFLMHNTFRTNIINKISAKCDNNILILVDRIEHGEILFNNLSGIPGKSTFYIKGAVDTIERERIKTILEQNNNSICIAISSIFSTGINIKNLHYIFFAAGGKAKVKIVQSIGRGLRLHNDKKRLVIFDISNNLNYSERHHTRRISLYEKEKIKYKIKRIDEPKSG